jgi:hypothetical protein
MAYSVEPNTTSATRTATIFVEGATFSITQSPGASEPPPPGCGALVTGAQTFGAGGGETTLTVTAPAGCAWTATSAASWLAIRGPTQASGTAPLAISIAPNPNASMRTTSLAVNGTTFGISQAAGDGGGDVYAGTLAGWDSVTADMTFTTFRTGAPASGTRAMSFTFERYRYNGSWRTRMTVQDVAARVHQTLDGPQSTDAWFGVSRIEFDEDGSPPRVYDRSGALIALTQQERQALDLPPPTAVFPATPSGDHWIESLIVPLAKSLIRNSSFVSQLGSAVGSINGLQRHMSVIGGEQIEMLIDPTLGVPIEMNVVQNGSLVSQRTYTYSAVANERFMRRSVRTEQLIPDSRGTRLVTILDVTNIQLHRR